MTEPIIETRAVTTIDLTTLRLPTEVELHATTLCMRAQKAVIDSPETLAKSSDVVVLINAHISEVDKQKETVARPLREALDAFYKIWHNARDPLESAKKLLVGKQSTYQREEQRKADEAAAKARREAEEKAQKEALALQKKANAAAAKGNEERAQALQAQANEKIEQATQVSPVAPVAQVAAKGGLGGVTYRDDPKWELQDISKVPAQYLMLNEKLINANVRAGVRDIPGLRIWVDKTPINKRT